MPRPSVLTIGLALLVAGCAGATASPSAAPVADRIAFQVTDDPALDGSPDWMPR